MTPVFDGHNDTLYRLLNAEDPAGMWRTHPDRHIDLERARAGGLAGGFFAIWTPPQQVDGEDFGRKFVHTDEGYEAPLAPPEDRQWAIDHANRCLALATTLAAEPDNGFYLVDHPGNWTPRAGQVGALLHLEGAEPLAPDLSDLDDWIERGIRSIGIVWSRPNAFGTGVPFRYPTSPDTGPGLTDAGKALVTACNERGVLVDLAHLNERGFWDVADITSAPIVVTHACANALTPTARNVTDTQIDAIGESGGVLGINFAAADLRPDGQRNVDAEAQLIVRHLTYVAERIGPEHVAFGSDFDGATVPSELDGARGYPALLERLAAAGFSDPERDGIASGNWRRVLGTTWNQRRAG